MTASREASWALSPRSKRNTPDPHIPPPPRVPRIAKLIALAIKLDEQVRQGVFRDYAEMARLGHLTRARLTQIMNLLHLAPDIQEYLLLNTAHSLTERHMRRILAETDWRAQRELWRELTRITTTERT